MTKCMIRKALETGILNLNANLLFQAASKAEASLLKHESTCRICQGLKQGTKRPNVAPRDRMAELLKEQHDAEQKASGKGYAGATLSESYAQEDGHEVVVYKDIAEGRTTNSVKRFGEEGQYIGNWARPQVHVPIKTRTPVAPPLRAKKQATVEEMMVEIAKVQKPEEVKEATATTEWLGLNGWLDRNPGGNVDSYVVYLKAEYGDKNKVSA